MGCKGCIRSLPRQRLAVHVLLCSLGYTAPEPLAPSDMTRFLEASPDTACFVGSATRCSGCCRWRFWPITASRMADVFSTRLLCTARSGSPSRRPLRSSSVIARSLRAARHSYRLPSACCLPSSIWRGSRPCCSRGSRPSFAPASRSDNLVCDGKALSGVYR